MIELIEAKDIVWVGSKIDELNERTKKHTMKIKELEKESKRLNLVILRLEKA